MRAAFLLMIWAVVWLVGCSDDATDRCANVECATGVCLPETGACGNPKACDENTTCLAGYSCLFDVCRADIECREDGTCQRGTCVDGACVNPQSCDVLGQCLADHACVDGQCVFDRCAEVECDRGECAKDTGECVNKTVCAENTQREDCVEGFVCYGQVCTEGFEVCRDITCERGVCDAPSKSCANAETCVSDTECLDNNFCNDENRCQANVCDAQMVSCARGVCDLRTGECINATTCAGADECTDGFSCIGGQCVAQGTECGEQGCPGNQVCAVNAVSLSAACTENPTGCGTAFDCLDERICRSGMCQDGAACIPDGFEPNDTVATDFRTVAVDASLQATVCRTDVDLYTFDTRDSALFTGTLLAVLALDREDTGLGSALLEIVDSTGLVVGSATTSAAGSARAEFAVTALKRGIYTIRVSDVDLKQSGARYRLYVDLLDPVAAQACVNPRMLVSGDMFTENSTSGASYQLGSSCTSPTNAAGENIYAFTLATPSYVDLTITPIDGALLSYAVRRQCEISTDDLACQAPGTSAVLRYQKILSPGTYFVVVQGNGSQSGGSYTLAFSANETVCSSDDNQCVGANMDFTYFCNQTGTGFLTTLCANGCNPATGNCVRKPTDVCETAADATGGLTAMVTWSTLTNDYDPGVGGCVPNSSGTQTNGPDAAYQVVVPPQSRVRAQLTKAIGDYVSLYIVTDCSDMLSCVAGANSSAFTDETIVWLNDSAMPRTVYVIADVEQANAYGTGNITIDVAPVVCQPSAITCLGDAREICNSDGSASTLVPCTFGCAAGACLPVTNDVCSGAIDLGAGAFTGQISEYLSDYAPSSGCTGRTAGNKDAAFYVTPPAGQVVTATVQAGFDSAIYVLRDCAAVSTSCVVGSDIAASNNETVQWLADGSTYYVIVDTNSGLATGDFTVSASWQPPQCVPGANLGCSGTSLSYCSDVGAPATYACQGGCTANACGTPSGQICADAVTLISGTSVTAPFSGVNSINPTVGQHGACTFLASEAPVGSDVIYTASLRAGEYLFADYTSSSSYAMMYLLTDCSDTDSCVAVTPDGTSGSIIYQAPQNQVVYIVMDRSTTGTTTLTHTLNVTINAPDCTPGQPNVCSDGNTLSYCDAYGITRSYSCASQGGCTAGACGQPNGNVCADPIVLTPGIPITGTLNRSGATNAITLRGPSSGACYIDDAINTLGNDTIYAVDLFPGDILRAQLTTTSTSAFIAILEDCDADACVASPVSSGATSVAAYAPTGGRYYIVVDATSEFTSTTGYTLVADVTANGVCSPEQGTCDASGAFSTVCNIAGTQANGPFACDAGCNLSGCAVSAAGRHVRNRACPWSGRVHHRKLRRSYGQHHAAQYDVRGHHSGWPRSRTRSTCRQVRSCTPNFARWVKRPLRCM
ncbi:MAG: hypothetical protein R3E66_02520 [bacterium]